MYNRKTMIINASGLHARPASEFVNEAKKYSSKIEIRHLCGNDYNCINAKSIVMLLSLGIGQGDEVEILAEGEDEKQAVDYLVNLIQDGFGEV